MQWTDLEDYRQLLQEYERRKAEYDRDLQAYRDPASNLAGTERESAKAKLDKEQAELESMFQQIKTSRSSLARSRDAALAQ